MEGLLYKELIYLRRTIMGHDSQNIKFLIVLYCECLRPAYDGYTSICSSHSKATPQSAPATSWLHLNLLQPLHGYTSICSSHSAATPQSAPATPRLHLNLLQPLRGYTSICSSHSTAIPQSAPVTPRL